MGKELEQTERLKLFMEEYRYNANQLANELGYTSGAVYHVVNGMNNLSEDFILRMVNRWPDLNYTWLKTGKGKMRLEKSEQTTQKNFFIPKNTKDSDWNELPHTLVRIAEALEIIAEKAKAGE